MKKIFQMCDNCCGCGACSIICSQNAIELEKNSKGFLYPRFNEIRCVGCGLCMTVCPLRNNGNTDKQEC